jgi:hypothetical protein
MLRFLLIAGLIAAAATSRLLPHPPNFTPIGAIALFGGAAFRDRRLAFAVPLLAMLLSDAALGFSRMMPFVYGSQSAIRSGLRPPRVTSRSHAVHSSPCS